MSLLVTRPYDPWNPSQAVTDAIHMYQQAQEATAREQAAREQQQQQALADQRRAFEFNRRLEFDRAKNETDTDIANRKLALEDKIFTSNNAPFILDGPMGDGITPAATPASTTAPAPAASPSATVVNDIPAMPAQSVPADTGFDAQPSTLAGGQSDLSASTLAPDIGDPVSDFQKPSEMARTVMPALPVMPSQGAAVLGMPTEPAPLAPPENSLMPIQVPPLRDPSAFKGSIDPAALGLQTPAQVANDVLRSVSDVNKAGGNITRKEASAMAMESMKQRLRDQAKLTATNGTPLDLTGYTFTGPERNTYRNKDGAEFRVAVDSKGPKLLPYAPPTAKNIADMDSKIASMTYVPEHNTYKNKDGAEFFVGQAANGQSRLAPYRPHDTKASRWVFGSDGKPYALGNDGQPLQPIPNGVTVAPGGHVQTIKDGIGNIYSLKPDGTAGPMILPAITKAGAKERDAYMKDLVAAKQSFEDAHATETAFKANPGKFFGTTQADVDKKKKEAAENAAKVSAWQETYPEFRPKGAGAPTGAPGAPAAPVVPDPSAAPLAPPPAAAAAPIAPASSAPTGASTDLGGTIEGKTFMPARTEVRVGPDKKPRALSVLTRAQAETLAKQGYVAPFIDAADGKVYTVK